MSGHTRHDRVENDCIREKVGIEPVVENMVESCLRWFGQVIKKHVEAPVRKVDQMEGSSTGRGRERPRKTTDQTITNDLKFQWLVYTHDLQ